MSVCRVRFASVRHTITTGLQCGFDARINFIFTVNLMMYKRDNLEDYFPPIQSRLLRSTEQEKKCATKNTKKKIRKHDTKCKEHPYKSNDKTFDWPFICSSFSFRALSFHLALAPSLGFGVHLFFAAFILVSVQGIFMVQNLWTLMIFLHHCTFQM